MSAVIYPDPGKFSSKRSCRKRQIAESSFSPLQFLNTYLPLLFRKSKGMLQNLFQKERGKQHPFLFQLIRRAVKPLSAGGAAPMDCLHCGCGIPSCRSGLETPRGGRCGSDMSDRLGNHFDRPVNRPGRRQRSVPGRRQRSVTGRRRGCVMMMSSVVASCKRKHDRNCQQDQCDKLQDLFHIVFSFFIFPGFLNHNVSRDDG